MDYIQPIELGIAEKLKTDLQYRKAFFRASSADSIALQIRALRKRRADMNQAELAEACGMKQSAISRVEQADYSSWTFKTLWRVAEALESKVVIRFQPWEEAIGAFEITEATQSAAADRATYSRVIGTTGTGTRATGVASAIPMLVETGSTHG